MSLGFAFLMFVAIVVLASSLLIALRQEHKSRQRQDAFEREMRMLEDEPPRHRSFRPF